MSLLTSISAEPGTFAQANNRLAWGNGRDANRVLHSDLSVTRMGMYAPAGPLMPTLIIPTPTASAATATLMIRHSISASVTNTIGATSVATTAGVTVCETARINSKFINGTYPYADGSAGSTFMELPGGRKSNMGMIRFRVVPALSAAYTNFTAGSAAPFLEKPAEFMDVCTGASLILPVDKTNSSNIAALPAKLQLFAPLYGVSSSPLSIGENDLSKWESEDCNWPFLRDAGGAEPVLWQGMRLTGVPIYSGRPLPNLHDATGKNWRDLNPPMLAMYNENAPIAEVNVPLTATVAGLPDTISFSGENVINALKACVDSGNEFNGLILQDSNANVRLYGATAASESSCRAAR